MAETIGRTALALTEQTVAVVEAKVGVSPELVEAWSGIGAAPTTTLFRGEKVMVWLSRAGGEAVGPVASLKSTMKVSMRVVHPNDVSGPSVPHVKKPPAPRGLNVNHNHDLKNIFKSAATGAKAWQFEAT